MSVRVFKNPGSQEIRATYLKFNENNNTKGRKGRSMSKKQRDVILVGIMLIVLMGLCPPWYGYQSTRPKQYDRPVSQGYSFIGAPPQPTSRIDKSRLFVQWITVVVATGGLAFIFKDNK